jgi:hypothetical protein
MTAERVSWGELGCPTEIGTYDVEGAPIRVRGIHIIVAENDPDALFTVIMVHPWARAPELMLGHRVL